MLLRIVTSDQPSAASVARFRRSAVSIVSDLVAVVLVATASLLFVHGLFVYSCRATVEVQ